MKRFFLLLLLLSSLHARVIEFYADWAWTAKGTRIFVPPPHEKEENWSVLWKIHSLLQERGSVIKSWDWDFYQPLMMKGEFAAWKDWKRREGNGADTLWVFWNMGGRLKDFDLAREPKEKLVLFMWEPPVVQPTMYTDAVLEQFGKVFTWDDDLVREKKFIKFNYPALKKRIAKVPSFDEKKFCVMINTHLKSKHPKELYSEREKVAQFFENKPGEFDLYGRFWEEFKNGKGTVKSKAATLSQYRFCICYENMRDVKGYITEKLFDCFMAGCVPIYWGASNITDYIPSDCFIDRRRFKSMDELYIFLKKMGRKDYEKYLENGARFIESEKAQVFSRDAFVKIFMDELVR